MKAKCRSFRILIPRRCIPARVSSVMRRVAVGCAMSGILLLNIYSFASAAVLHVDRNNPQCSDLGQGTAQAPYCRIGAAAAVAAAGDTVVVSAGNYNEQVVVANSGTQNAPIVFTAADGASVNIFGQEYGFRISGRSWITVNGFTISDTSKNGIFIKGSPHVTISNNHVTRSGLPINGLNYYGIKLDSATDCIISGNTVDFNTDSGIYLTNGSTRNTIDGNHISYNAQQYSRAAAGMDIRGPGNIIKNNISHHNEDSGIQLRSGGGDNLVVNNLIYRNGDHGIDVSFAPGQRIIGNTVYGNPTSGINVEGSSSYTTLANNITVDNGIRSPRKDGNINITAESAVGTVIDHDLVWLSEPWIMIVWGNNDYMSLADFVAATGQEANGIEAEPNWIDPQNGNFRLMAGSPAIDSADSSADGAEPEDIDSNPRVDDASVPNTGTGPRTYDDRGAYEYQAANLPDNDPPTVVITTPDDDETVWGTVTVTAGASDNVGVVGVQFKLDGNDLYGADTTPPYSINWDSTEASEGAHTLAARACDAAGNCSDYDVTVLVDNSTDRIAPTGAVTAPAPGATVSGTVLVAADASDNVGVAGVQFKLGGANLGVEDTTAPYSVLWDSTLVGDGLVTLRAVARDAAGNEGVSSGVSVTVSNFVDTVSPEVSITAPTDGATVSGTVTVSSVASDNVGVVGVQFKLDGVNLGAEDTASPYSVSWNTLSAGDGESSLTAVARDAAGNTRESLAVTVTVDNGTSLLTFNSVADASILSSYPTTNYGTSTTLLVDNSPLTRFLIRFSVAGIGAQSVASAKLRLYCANGSNRGGDFYETADDWSEGTVTWNNAPAAGSSAVASLGPVTKKTWVEVDVTPLIAGDGTYSLLVSSPSSDGADYNSRERVGFEPQLVLMLQ
jgi:parallel beta-helix repeat protein